MVKEISVFWMFKKMTEKQTEEQEFLEITCKREFFKLYKIVGQAVI